MLERLKPLWEQRRGSPAAVAVLVLAAIVLAWQLGRLVWLLWSGPAISLAAPPARPAPAQVGTDAPRIGKLFGESGEAPQAQGAVVDTTLQLRLDGIMENRSREFSRAFIAERSSGKVEIYHPGDDVPGGARLDRIETDHVVLTRGGREEILRFDTPASAGATPPAAATAGAAGARSALDMAAQRFANSPLVALRQMGLRRTSQGYIVSITAPKDMMQRYGLQPGDRVVSINGQPVGKDLEADQQIIGQLQQGGNARVEVQRGAQTITLEQKL